MARSNHTDEHFTFVEECDVSALKSLRARLRPAAEKEGVKLTYLPFIVKAVVAALRKHPTLNSAFDEATQEIVVRRYYDIGVASATDAGLIVPVVRSADQKSILDIARTIARLGEQARAGKLAPSDLGGSTFTITSLGAQGGLFATPILNFPEVGILGVHQMKQKPVVRDGQIVIGDGDAPASLSFDHRIIDGHVGAAFANEIIGYLEDPDRLFLEMALLTGAGAWARPIEDARGDDALRERARRATGRSPTRRSRPWRSTSTARMIDANEAQLRPHVRLLARRGWSGGAALRGPHARVPARSPAALVERGAERDVQLTALHKDGTVFPIEVRVRSCSYQGRAARVALLRDLRDQRRNEA